MPTPTEMLNLAAGIGQRQAAFRFALIDAVTSRALGDVHPIRGCQLQHDTTRTIVRTVGGFQLDKTETAALDVLADRVQVFMTVGGTEYPLGTYVFTDGHRTLTSEGRRGDYGLSDLGFVVAQPTETTTSFGAGRNVGDCISEVLASVALPFGYIVEATGAVTGAPVSWPAGTDRARILGDLAALGAYFTPYMDNASVIRVRQAFDPVDEAAAFTLAAGGRVRNNSISESDDLLAAPNAFIVIDNANTANPVVGRYDIPVTAPHSAANRGFVVPQVTSMQGVGTVPAADAAARALGLQATVFEHVTLATPPDPRHDGYDVVAFDNKHWLETAWTMTLVEGAEMTHTLQRAYGEPFRTGDVA